MAVTLSGMTLYTSNDNEAGWTVRGNQSDTDGPDDFFTSIQGTNSESWTVSKDSIEEGFLDLAASFNATRSLFIFWMKSDISQYYTNMTLELATDASNFKSFEITNSTNKLVSGDFRAQAFDYVNKGTATGTYNPASHAYLRIEIDNNLSGNIRAVTNNWIDAMYHGSGHTVSGTTTTDKLFLESWQYEYVDDINRRYGVLENYNGIIFCQADLDLSGTALVSDGETLVFVDSLNGYDIYNLDITGTVSFINTSVLTAGAKRFNLNTASATSFSMVGGALEGGNTLTLSSGNTFENVVVSNSTLISMNAAASGCQFVNNTLIVVGATGSLVTCQITPEAAATVAVETADLGDLDACTFNGDGTGHAVELTDIGTGTMSWNCTTTGYDAGSIGSPVTPTNTGNEAIYINPPVATSSPLTINSTGTTPSIRVGANFTGAVNIVANQTTVTLSPLIANSEVRVYSRDVNGDNDIELFGVENSGTSFQFTTNANDAVNIVIFHKQYQPVDFYNFIVPTSNQTVQVQQRFDRNFIGTAP